MPSFDIVSEVHSHEPHKAFHQANRAPSHPLTPGTRCEGSRS